MGRAKIEIELNDNELTTLTNVVDKYQEAKKSEGKKSPLHEYHDTLKRDPYTLLFRLNLIEAYGSQGSIQFYVVNTTKKGLEFLANIKS